MSSVGLYDGDADIEILVDFGGNPRWNYDI